MQLVALQQADIVGQIGDLPTKFKYTRSTPQSFGLTPVEILLADESELNGIVSMKHIAAYRHRGLGKAARGLDKRVRDLRSTLKDRKWGDESEEVGNPGKAAKASGTGANGIAVGKEEAKRKGKRKGKKERMRLRVGFDAVEGGDGEADPKLGFGAVEAEKVDSVEREDRRPGVSHVAMTDKPRDNPVEVNKRKSEHGVDAAVNSEGNKKRRKKKRTSEAGGGERMLEVFE